MHVLIFLPYRKECSYSWAMHSCTWETGMAEDISSWKIEKGVKKIKEIVLWKIVVDCYQYILMCCCMHVSWHFMSYTQLAEGLLTTKVLTRPSKLDWIRTCSVLANFMPSTYFPVSFARSLKKIFTTTQKLLPSFFFENRNNNVIMEVSFCLLSICNSDWFQDPELHT